MSKVFDTTQNCTASAKALKDAGYETIVRYYCVDANKWKRIAPPEARALSEAGLNLCAVYQDRQNQDGDFTAARGRLAGHQAYVYAQTAILQPEGSAIYFSADYDPDQAAIDNCIVPFFQGVRDAIATASGTTATTLPYRIGIYGSGLTCRTLLTQKLVELAWLAQSTGFRGYQDFLKSGDWRLSQKAAGSAAGIPGDPDDVQPQYPAPGDYGASSLAAGHFGPAQPPAWRVNAGNGLRVRSGPGTNFDIVSVLSNGQPITVLARAGDWAQIDADHDGSPEGYCLASYLTYG